MNWTGFSDFIAMGGYGLYVWGAWGGALLLMAAESWFTVRVARQAEREDAR